jgi:hypothetical protein
MVLFVSFDHCCSESWNPFSFPLAFPPARTKGLHFFFVGDSLDSCHIGLGGIRWHLRMTQKQLCEGPGASAGEGFHCSLGKIQSSCDFVDGQSLPKS